MVIPRRMSQYLPMFPRTALVTGAASGIGAAIVTLLESSGCEVLALDLRDGFDVRDPGAWERVVAAGFPLLQPEEVGHAILTAARSDDTGRIWVVQPGREPVQFRFANVPGPRDP